MDGVSRGAPVWRKHVVYAWLPPEGVGLGLGLGMPPSPRTALLRQTGGNLHALQPAGGVLKRQPISQVCSICAASVTQTNLSPCFSWACCPQMRRRSAAYGDVYSEIGPVWRLHCGSDTTKLLPRCHLFCMMASRFGTS